MAVLLVRHAKAGSRDKWRGPGPDELRSLSKKGWRQAEGLVALLQPFGVRRVLSSPYARCVQTVQPLAEALGLEVGPAEDLAEGADSRRALALVRLLMDTAPGGDGAPPRRGGRAGGVPARGRDTVLSSHGDVIPGVLDLLAAEEDLELTPGYPCEKGSTWVLTRANGQWVARYLPPPA